MTASPSPAYRAATLLATIDPLAERAEGIEGADGFTQWDSDAIDAFCEALVNEWPAVRTLINDLLAAVERAETDADRLRSYAKHHSGCWQLASHTPGMDRCDCGLGTALHLHDEAVTQR